MSERSPLATSGRLTKIHSRILKNGAGNTMPPRPESYRLRQEPKQLNVTITMLSLTGFRAAESKNRISMAKILEQMRSTDGGGDMSAATNLVASFENGANKTETSNGIPMTHIPSLSFQLPSPFSHKSTFSDIVSWPEHAAESFWPEQAKEFTNMSSFQFQRKFVPESGTSRLQPQVCPIQISVSRHGQMYKLGVASVFVNGEERGESSIIVPVAIDERMLNGSKQQLDEVIPMVSLKGDTMKCSLDRNCSIRVLVKVSDPNATDFTKPVTHFIDPVLSAGSDEYDACQAEEEGEKDTVTYAMFSGDVFSRGRSTETSLRSASTDNSSAFSSVLDSHPYSTDDEDEDWSLFSASNTSIAFLKDQLRKGGVLLPSVAKQKLMSPTSLDDTTVSSSSSTSTSSSVSELLSSVQESFAPKARNWANRLLACGVPVCGCRDNTDDELLSTVDENSIL